MEKLINKKNIILFSIISIFFLIFIFFVFVKSQNKNQKYFDIILAGLYNEQVDNYDDKLNYLSTIDDPNVSFFSDLDLSSTENLEKYQKIDRDLILLKKTLQNLDQQALKNLSLDDNFIFSDIAKIFFLNNDLKNYSLIYSENDETIENFFMKAVKRYNNEVN